MNVAMIRGRALRYWAARAQGLEWANYAPQAVPGIAVRMDAKKYTPGTCLLPPVLFAGYCRSRVPHWESSLQTASPAPDWDRHLRDYACSCSHLERILQEEGIDTSSCDGVFFTSHPRQATKKPYRGASLDEAVLRAFLRFIYSGDTPHLSPADYAIYPANCEPTMLPRSLHG